MNSRLLRILTISWVGIFVYLAYEYAILHGIINANSGLQFVLCDSLELCRKLEHEAGKNLSYWLGWLGFSVMCLTNIYILRKRVPSLAKLGRLSTHMDWHIFFGLVGPTFILFHCDFKVGGLVAISFWSMVVSFASGVVGRYFYLQLLQQKSTLKQSIGNYEDQFTQYLELTKEQGVQKKHLDYVKSHALSIACGGIGASQLANINMAQFLYHSILGEIRLRTRMPPVPLPGGKILKEQLRTWAFLRRKLIFMHYYKILFGYWKTFHTPFAVFMYIVAIIHIISSLIFKVN